MIKSDWEKLIKMSLLQTKIFIATFWDGRIAILITLQKGYKNIIKNHKELDLINQTKLKIF